MTLKTRLFKIIIACAVILIIALLMLDLVFEDRSIFIVIFVPYGILLIINSKLLCDVITCSSIENIEKTFFVWNTVYLAANLLNIATDRLLIPIPSRSVLNFVNRLIWSLHPTNLSLSVISGLVSGIYMIVPITVLISTFDKDAGARSTTKAYPGWKPSIKTPKIQRRASV